jgi:hypothetical protein
VSGWAGSTIVAMMPMRRTCAISRVWLAFRQLGQEQRQRLLVARHHDRLLAVRQEGRRELADRASVLSEDMTSHRMGANIVNSPTSR